MRSRPFPIFPRREREWVRPVLIRSGCSMPCTLIKGLHAGAERLAREACQIEIDVCRKPIGKQDQYIAAYGGLQCIRFNPDGSVWVDPIVCKPETKAELERRLLLFYTGITRSADTILEEQKQNTLEQSPRSAARCEPCRKWLRPCAARFVPTDWIISAKCCTRAGCLKRSLTCQHQQQPYRSMVRAGEETWGHRGKIAGGRRRRFPPPVCSSRTSSGHHFRLGRIETGSL